MAEKESTNSFVTNVGDISELLCIGGSDALEVESCIGTLCDVLTIGEEFEHGRVLGGDVQTSSSLDSLKSFTERIWCQNYFDCDGECKIKI